VAAVTSTGGPRGVLLLCQSEETLGALAAILDKAGIIVLIHQDLKDAWEHVKSGRAGCVVLDAEGPATEALAFFRAARSSAKTCEIPFLFLIAKDSPLPQFDGLAPEVAPDAWLLLPCSAEQFLKQIRAMLAHTPKQAAAQPLAKPFEAVEPATGPALPAPPQKLDTVFRFVPAPEELLQAPGAVFAGRLGVLDVTKIVSMVEPLRLTGVLKMSDGKRYGQVHFIEGAVRHAELHEIEGPDALFLLFHLKTGAFRFDIETEPCKRTIEGNTMALLLEGLRQMDEAKELVKAFQHRKAGSTGGHVATPTA